MFGLREIERKERGKREMIKNIIFSIIWFIIKKGKEMIFFGWDPLKKKSFQTGQRGKEHLLFLFEMT
jgi:hypothetical protein